MQYRQQVVNKMGLFIINSRRDMYEEIAQIAQMNKLIA